MGMRQNTTALVWMALAFLSSSVRADQIELTSGRDTTIYEDVSGLYSNGAGRFMLAGTSGLQKPTEPDLILRGLLFFALSGIPAGAVVDDVGLALRSTTPRSRAGTINVHRARANWGEGTSDAGKGEGGGVLANATAGDATWLHNLFSGSQWMSPGGDFAAEVSASQRVVNQGSFLWSDSALVADVQRWLDTPSENFGWVLRLEEEGARALRFGSFNGPVAARPRLIVDFTAIPEPNVAVLLGAGLAALAAVDRKSKLRFRDLR